MTYHLPERAICICDRLRACEERVREDELVDKHPPVAVRCAGRT